MTIKASGRSVSIIAAGIWICFSGPLLAARGGDAASAQVAKIEGTSTGKLIALKKFAKHSSRNWKKHAWARKPGKTAGTSLHEETGPTDVAATDEGTAAPALPADIANANAALLPTDAPADDADARLVSADQLNDVDRVLSESSEPAQTEATAPVPLLTMAAANTPVISAPTPVSTAVSSEDTAWSKSSIIGKIFIAFGGLLTLASAARMFMA